ncbi:MAG: hypothetical protein AAF750_12970 [Planctomycetota bacterium]
MKDQFLHQNSALTTRFGLYGIALLMACVGCQGDTDGDATARAAIQQEHAQEPVVEIAQRGERHRLMDASSPGTADFGAWAFGDSLATAAVMWGDQGDAAAASEQWLSALRLANVFRVGLTPLPLTRPGETQEQRMARALNYLMDEGGRHAAVGVRESFGDRAAVIFELALKSKVIALMHVPSSGMSDADTILDRSRRLELPEALYVDAVEALRLGVSSEDAATRVLAMSKAVGEHFALRAKKPG